MKGPTAKHGSSSASSSLGRCLLVALLLALTQPIDAGGPDTFIYQIPFPDSPADGASAIASLRARTRPVLSALACGSELEFALSQEKAGEDSTALLIAKLEWARGHPDRQGALHTSQPCTFTRYVEAKDLCAFMSGKPSCDEAETKAFSTNFTSAWRNQSTHLKTRTEINALLRGYFPQCKVSPPSVDLNEVSVPAPPPSPLVRTIDIVRLDFWLDRECLLKQISHSLTMMRVDGDLGTSGLPCRVFLGATSGDWDFAVMNLTRLAYLDRLHKRQHGQHLIGPAALKNLTEQLMTTDGGPAEESYSVIGCGNTEESTGSSQERVDERDWTDTPFWQTVGDILWTLFKLLAIFVIAFLIALAVFTALGATVAGAVVAAGAVAAATLLVQPVFPETENHLLMINSSKFLKNQMIIEEVPSSSGTNRYRKDQRELKGWLLAKMQTLLKQDFIEYNSRPYGRLSLFAIHNLADFSDDAEVREGARLVLDYATAKFAIGSQQGRRFVPFRRKREYMAKRVDVGASAPNGLFDLVVGGDHLIGLGLIYAGQTQQMRGNFVSIGTAIQGLYASTSLYHPEEFVLDLAIKKEMPVFQRIRHVTGEVYSSGRGYLISGGGTATGPAYTGTGSPALDLTLSPGLKDDYGVALPTTLFLAKSQKDDPVNFFDRDVGRTTLKELIRIDGQRPEKGTEFPSYDSNLCVWDGFACGVNLVVPPAEWGFPAAGFAPQVQVQGSSIPCLSAGPPGSPAEWTFVDTAHCLAYKEAPRVYIAIYRQSCSPQALNCEDNFGFFEVMDATGALSFSSFKANVIAANPPGFIQHTTGITPQMTGTYNSARGQRIEFRCAGSAVLSVDGKSQPAPDSWRHAQGSSEVPPGTVTPMTSDGDGLVRVWNSVSKKTLELDFRDMHAPKRRVQ